MTRKNQQPVTPKLRFPEFRDSEGWASTTVAYAVKTVTPTKKLKTSQYDEAGSYPVIDQSADAICGWTDDEEAVIRKPLPVIVFGDHTCVIKKADVPFAQGADGIKILVGRNGFDTDFLYQLLCARPLKFEGYKRHFTKLKLVDAPRPPLSAEQQKIADCLGSLDDLITAEGRKLEALRDHKKGLMQQLFPRQGETQPRLRFPEFRSALDWKGKALGTHVKIRSGGSPSQFVLSAHGTYPFVKVEDLNNCTKYQITAREFCDDGKGGVPRNSLLFPKRGAAIELNKIRITGTEILIDTNLMAITPTGELDAEFLFYYISSIGLAHIADTSTIPQINNKHIIPFKILFPSMVEQHHIADCLSALDTRIAAQAEKLEALRTHKRGLMQQLFPSQEPTTGGGV